MEMQGHLVRLNGQKSLLHSISSSRNVACFFRCVLFRDISEELKLIVILQL